MPTPFAPRIILLTGCEFIWPCVSNYPVVIIPGHHENRHEASAEQWGGSQSS